MVIHKMFCLERTYQQPQPQWQRRVRRGAGLGFGLGQAFFFVMHLLYLLTLGT
ncbi:hypothetical protein ACE3NQ_30060 [Paenibacillus terreus]|uniref:Uncharacterized protein n=1 Tax=Paenibacillus terreus TaxID=1387834 RepID=A0ABV5BHH4_9BACL